MQKLKVARGWHKSFQAAAHWHNARPSATAACVHCQARGAKILRALPGTKRQDFSAGSDVRRPNISARTHAMRQQVLRDGRREAASFQCHECGSFTSSFKSYSSLES
ncbi:hypothetical protein HAX54_011173 [Datura stramonium]|uniref:Uncharacterized protein n=1 Tax=Datura stramonium TaxID=4076 RepID=A0ABS8X0E4_DATST|nr:hypothetical protein [Datura stramonium]